MEWVTSLKKAIGFMEEHLLENIGAEETAAFVNMSPFYLQKGFQIMTGYSIGEYLRNRRLYLAAVELSAGGEKIIEIAYKYGYDTPEGFTKAFTRFHGVTPSQLRRDGSEFKIFLPLNINVVIQGGDKMNFTVEKMDGFTVIGFAREFSFETAYEEIPKFWDEIIYKYARNLFAGKTPQNALEKAFAEHRIGEFGVCIGDIGKEGKFRYLIAGRYADGDVPEGMVTYELPEAEWVKFKCVGALPEALQDMNSKIFREWLPGNGEFEIACGVNLEWYGSANIQSTDYESGIWLPVVRK